MEVFLRKSPLASRAADVLAVGVHEQPRLNGAALTLDRAARGAVTALMKTGDFKGRHAETAVLYPKGVKAKRVLLVGLRALEGRADLGPRHPEVPDRDAVDVGLGDAHAVQVTSDTDIMRRPSGRTGLAVKPSVGFAHQGRGPSTTFAVLLVGGRLGGGSG